MVDLRIRKFLIVIGIITIVGWKTFYHPKLSKTAFDFLVTYSQDSRTFLWGAPGPCAIDRGYCVYIYLAPWCPHCRELLPVITDYRSSWKADDRPGLKVIVGNGERQAINEMAARISPPVYLDFHDQFLKALHVKYFPYFVIVDRNQSVIASGEDAFHWVENEINLHVKK
ncbi:MAG: hypothetical protein HQL14_01360 [Candidatus Omnitrophica bacterium]|nr:hypothetical protein [Candidatus Omnitrophota bacterium]